MQETGEDGRNNQLLVLWSFMMMKIPNEIQIVGIVQPEIGSGKVHLQDYIYNSYGIAPTLTARDVKDPRRIVVFEDDEKVQTNSIHSS